MPRCPRCHKALSIDVGAHESRGDLEVAYVCDNDGYQEVSAGRAEVARKSSPIVRQIAAERLLRQRLAGFSRDKGVEVPMRYERPGGA